MRASARKTLYSAGLAILAVFCIAALVTGHDVLGANSPIPGLPLGNLITPLGMVALAGLALLHATVWVWTRWISLLALVLGALWLPASLLMAGNLRLSFSGNQGVLFWFLTGLVAALCVLAPLTVGVSHLWKRLHR